MFRHSTIMLVLAALLGAAPALAADPKLAPTPNPFIMPKAPDFPKLDTLQAPIPAKLIETSAEKPRLAVVSSGTPKEFEDQLIKSLDAMHRFAVITPAPQALTAARPTLGASMLPANAARLRAAAKVDMAVTCDVKSTNNELRASARLADLRTGDVSRELAIFGGTKEVKTLAATLASYIRGAAPIRCLVRAASEDEIVLDLGANDGMRPETTFQVLRYPQNLRPVPVATVKLTRLDKFRAHAEVEDAAPGMTVAPGDVAVEETGDLSM
jgi:hypothetical protein